MIVALANGLFAIPDFFLVSSSAERNGSSLEQFVGVDGAGLMIAAGWAG